MGRCSSSYLKRTAGHVVASFLRPSSSGQHGLSASRKETSVCRGKKSACRQGSLRCDSEIDESCRKGVDINLETCKAVELNDVPSRFYVSLGTKEGGVYKRSSYFSARAAICRYVSKDITRPFNVFQTPESHASNRVLDGVLKKNESVAHYSSLFLDRDTLGIAQ